MVIKSKQVMLLCAIVIATTQFSLSAMEQPQLIKFPSVDHRINPQKFVQDHRQIMYQNMTRLSIAGYGKEFIESYQAMTEVNLQQGLQIIHSRQSFVSSSSSITKNR